MKHNLKSLAEIRKSGLPNTWLTCDEYPFAGALLDFFASGLASKKYLAAYGRTTRKDGLHKITRFVVEVYVSDVKNKTFPTDNYSYKD